MSNETLAQPLRKGSACGAVQSYALTLIVDLDERGSFRAHVETSTGKTVFSFSNEDDNGWPSEYGLWLVEAGYMRHTRDTDGLLDYMRSMGMVGANATLTIQR
jgi:hypothetical protein